MTECGHFIFGIMPPRKAAVSLFLKTAVINLVVVYIVLSVIYTPPQVRASPHGVHAESIKFGLTVGLKSGLDWCRKNVHHLELKP